MAHTDAVVVLTTIATNDEAVTLIRELLDRRLIACGTVLPGGRSIYRWEGKIHDENEVLVLFKTRAETVERLKARILELHPYEVPEILCVPVESGYQAYLDWLSAQTR